MQNLQNNTFNKFRNIANGHSFDIHTIQWVKENSEYKKDIAQSNNHFQIIWITRGKGQLWIDLKKCDFQNNQLFFIKPSLDELEGYVISFTDSFLGIENQVSDSTYHGSLFQLFTNKNGIQISTELVSEMKDAVEKMIKEYNNFHLFRDEMLRRYLKILFIFFSRHFEGILQTTKQTRNIELVQKFMSLLDKNFKTEKMVSGYASLLSVTPNYLNEIIKKTTGYSAGYHIRQRIVLEAKRQATYSDTCMKQIGYYLGFNDMAHFSKFFKSATGMNFSDFKKEKMVISVAS
jgi:AraC family transcriptional regulator, transcriptional activator of pobA